MFFSEPGNDSKDGAVRDPARRKDVTVDTGAIRASAAHALRLRRLDASDVERASLGIRRSKMLYVMTLSLHSCVRWLVVLLTLANVTSAIHGSRRRRSWTPRDASLARAWVGVVDVQLLLGMAMYFELSPVTEHLPGLTAIWALPTIRFFAILHPLAMVGVVISAHAGAIGARRSGSAAQRFGRVAWSAGGALLLLAVAVPWPFYDLGRPLARIP